MKLFLLCSLMCNVWLFLVPIHDQHQRCEVFLHMFASFYQWLLHHKISLDTYCRYSHVFQMVNPWYCLWDQWSFVTIIHQELLLVWNVLAIQWISCRFLIFDSSLMSFVLALIQFHQESVYQELCFYAIGSMNQPIESMDHLNQGFL